MQAVWLGRVKQHARNSSSSLRTLQAFSVAVIDSGRAPTQSTFFQRGEPFFFACFFTRVGSLICTCAVRVCAFVGASGCGCVCAFVGASGCGCVCAYACAYAYACACAYVCLF